MRRKWRIFLPGEGIVNVELPGDANFCTSGASQPGTDELCGLRQVPFPLWASVSSSDEVRNSSTHSPFQ